MSVECSIRPPGVNDCRSKTVPMLWFSVFIILAIELSLH